MTERVSAHLITQGTYLVRVDASLDARTGRELDHALGRVRAEGAREVVVDLTDVAHAHAAGIEALVRAGRRAVRDDALVTVACADPNVWRILDLVGASRTLVLADGVGEAFAMVAQRSPAAVAA